MTIIQGVLLLLMALACAGYGVFFAFFFDVMLAEAERAQMQAGADPASNLPFQMLGTIGIGIGVFVFVISVLHFIAGIRALNYRGQGFTHL